MSTPIEVAIESIELALDEAKTVPFSKNKSVDVDVIKAAIEDIRLSMPDVIMQANKIVSERGELLEQARKDANQIILSAQEQAKEIVSENEITKGAQAAAADIMQQAKNQANDIVEQARQTAAELTDQAQKWATDMRTSANEFVESIIAEADDALTDSVNEIRRARKQIKLAASQGALRTE